jgi:hypothetical protein
MSKLQQGLEFRGKEMRIADLFPVTLVFLNCLDAEQRFLTSDLRRSPFLFSRKLFF